MTVDKCLLHDAAHLDSGHIDGCKVVIDAPIAHVLHQILNAQPWAQTT